MASEFTNDGKHIFINAPYAEAYIPDEIFDKDIEDPTAASIAYNTGESIVTIGIFYMRFFKTEDDRNRERTEVRTVNYPNMITTRPSGNMTKEVLTINGVSDTYRVLRYSQGDIFMDATSKKAASNAEMFTSLVMSGKIPRSLSYDDIYFAWKKCFEINDINPAVPMVSLQMIVSEMCRNPANTTDQFRKVIGQPKKVSPYDYLMLGMNAVSAYSSIMSSMSFERFSEKLTTSIIMTKEGIAQKKSPIEEVITM